MRGRGFHEQKRWGTRTFNEGTRMDGKSEEDGMEGKLCTRGVH